MTVKHTKASDGSQAWTHPKTNSSVSRRPDGSFWCEDSAGYVYGFRGLSSNPSAPSDLRRLARQAERDLAQPWCPGNRAGGVCPGLASGIDSDCPLWGREG